MRTFLLGGHPHQREISRIPYLTNLSVSSLSKPKHYTSIYIYIYIYIYTHLEAWFARDIMIHTLAMIYILAMILTLAMIHTLAMGNINCHTCVLKCQR
jgi:hypothetical protein